MTQQQKKSVNPLLAVAIVLFYGALLVAWLWARGQMTAVPTPAQFAVLPNGGALVAFQQQLYQLGDDGVAGQGVSIVGMSDSVGMAVRDEDDVFVYLGGEQRVGFMDHWRTFLRAEQPTTHPEQDEGIYLCRLTSGSCVLFSRQFVVTGNARLHWDAARQQLIVADTGQHQLLVLDKRGQLVRTLRGFHYPNGIWQSGDLLLVADTNHHRIAQVNLTDLAAPVTAKKIVPDGSHRWPSTVIQVGKQYWVLVADNNMGNSWLYRYDDHWQPLGRVDLPLADMVNLVPLGEGALVADLASHSLWRLDANGQPMAEVWLPGMQQAQEDFHYWQKLSWALLMLLVGTFVAGFVFAWWDERRHTLTEAVAAPESELELESMPPALPTPATETWIEPSSQVRHRGWMGVPFLLVVLGALPVFWFTSRPDGMTELRLPLLLMLAIALAIGAASHLLLSYIGRSGLGSKGTMILLRTPAGWEVSGEGEQIRYSNSFLVIDDVIMPLGNWRNRGSRNKGSFWNRQQLQELVVPALHKAQKLGAWQALVLLWELRFWPLLLLDAAILLALLVVFLAKYYGII